FDGQRAIELERPEWEVHPMASEVRHRAVAEVPPAVPFRPGQIDFIERALRRGAQPQVPIQTGEYGRAVRRAVLDEDYVAGRLRLFFAGMQAPGAADPHMRFGDGPDRPALDHFDDEPVIVAGVDLRPHLRRELGFGSGFADDARLPDVMRERLLAVDVLAQLQRRHGGERMRVLGRADDYRVELLCVVVDLAEIRD